MKTYEQYIRVSESGEPELYPFEYLDFYEANAHPYHEFMFEEGREKVYEGITAKDFHLRHKEGFWHIVQPILQDKRLEQLQDELEEEGKQVCMFNMYILAMFLVEKSKSRYLFLLKPTISETLSALKDVSKITFTNKDGSTVESSSSFLIKMVMEILEANKESDAMNYEVDKVETWDKVSNNSIMQSYFVKDLTMFLHTYFPVKRKKNALISKKEVELILYLMKIFNLSTVELTNKRYWQLMKTYQDINKQIPEYLEHEGSLIPLYFIPYPVWSNSKVEWTGEELPVFSIKEGMKIKF